MSEIENTIFLEADYLIVGAGAVGMAFADVILSETDFSIVMVDRMHKPGGHWNLAYPFVKLHQPSAFYGVSSTELGNEELDPIGLNKGLRHLASGSEILAYFDDIMQSKFLPSGRLKYFPLCDYKGDNRFVSKLSGKNYQVKISRKLVNATHMKTKVPSTHVPNFSVSREVTFMPINDLPGITEPPEEIVIIGGGKTGVDAILWLLENEYPPDKITWVISRDAWFTDRKNTQPSQKFLKDFLLSRACQFEALEHASSVSDLFDRLEKSGVLVRIDKNIRPQMYRGATVSQLELEELRRVKNTVRMGRVSHIEKGEVKLERGMLEVSPATIFVDCSADALSHGEITKVFSGNQITIQPVRGGQIVFSAAFIAHVDITYEDESKKNELCKVVPLPSKDTDWLKMLAGTMENQRIWRKDPELSQWLLNNRLDGFSKLMADIGDDEVELVEIRKRIGKSVGKAMKKLQIFVSEL
jgi:hypothetical protein